ncbi:MAG: hypothetical protein WC113_04095 [Candidatus Paceibacterota bacterium]
MAQPAFACELRLGAASLRLRATAWRSQPSLASYGLAQPAFACELRLGTASLRLRATAWRSSSFTLAEYGFTATNKLPKARPLPAYGSDPYDGSDP